MKATLVLSNHMPQIEAALTTMGRPVIVCLTRSHAALRGPEQRYPVLTVLDWYAYHQLIELADHLRGQIGHVATRWEGAVIAAGFIRDRLGLPGQTHDEAIGFVDKAVMKRRLKLAGVPVAKHRVVTRIADVADVASEFGWPVVVKPRKGFASTNVHVITGRRDLAEYLADGLFTTPIATSAFYQDDLAFVGLAHQPDGVLVEEYVDVIEEYHIDGLWIDGEPVYQLPGLYHTPPLHGMGGMLGSVLLDSDSGDGAIASGLAAQAARALKMRTGFTHAEVLRTRDNRWLLGEIAARPGGGGIQTAIGHAYGIDVPAIQAQLACGERPDVRLTRRAGYVGWAGPAAPPGRIAHIAAREDLLGHPAVIDATVAVRIGQLGGRTGSGLWGGLAGYTYLHGDTPVEVLAAMREATERYQVRVERPLAELRP